MKAATGELNLTLITVVAIGLIAALFAALWPTIKANIEGTWNDTANNLDGLSYNYYDYDFPNYIESDLF